MSPSAPAELTGTLASIAYPELTYYTGEKYKGDQVLNLAKQLATIADPTKMSGGVYGEKNPSVGFDYSEAQKLLGGNPTTFDQVLLDAAANLVKQGYTDVSQLKSNTYRDPETGEIYDLGSINAGQTYSGPGVTNYNVVFDPTTGKPSFITTGADTGDKGLLSIVGLAATALGVPGIIGSAIAPTASAATQAAIGGAVFGGGMAAAGGGDVLKGALLGGALGYGGSQLSQALNSGVSDPTLLKQAADADMAAGMLPEYGTNAAYDSAMQNLMANSPGAVQQLQDVVNRQVGGTLGPDNIDVGGGWNPATGTGDIATAQAANPYLNTPSADVPAAINQTPSVPTTTTPLAASAAGGGSLLSKLTDNPLTTAAVVSGLAGGVNAGITGNAINNALSAQLAAGQQAGSTLKDIYNQQLGFVAPYQKAGLTGLDLLGQNQDYLTHQFDATDLAKGLAPNYNFMLQQGQMANQRAANVGGGALSGNTLQGLNQFTQNYAGNAYQNAFNNYQQQRQNIFNTLSNIAGMGQTANAQAIGAGTNYGQQQTNLATGLAAAQAGATMGQSQNQANLISNLANNVTLASLLGQKQAVGTPTA